MTQTIASVGRAAVTSASRAAVQVATRQASQAATRALFGPKKRIVEGRALDEVRLLTAGEGVGIPRVYGRGRVGGQIIWASSVREETKTHTTLRGAKGTSAASETRTVEYQYFVSLAIALCEGQIARIGRVWADAKLITLNDFNYRIYHGTEDQEPDTLIESHEGTAPAYSGLAYIVFEDLPLAVFGNRIPQFNIEVERPLLRDDPAALENAVRAVTIIPGSGEAVYATEPLFETPKEGVSQALNRHNGIGIADFEASLDALEGTLPNVGAAALVVSWFGNDLRAGQCQIRPGVELRDRKTSPEAWRVASYDRNSAYLISRTDDRPSYGGTPLDTSVRQAIRSMKARGLTVMLHPFVLMDVPQGNGLPDPYGNAEQSSFPWRGRITTDLLSEDGTAGARAQVNSFFDEFDQMVVHYAQIAKEEGGVDAFLLGSELRGLTRIRDHNGAFPAVERLIALVAQVRAHLPGAKLSYGADWSEYFGYQPTDGSGDVLYPLDAFWAHPDVDFVGIDNYMPLSDWRDGEIHVDASLADRPYDRDYLKAGITSGEGYDWYYATDQDRLAQNRSPIVDGAYGEDWVYRYKDLWSWWSHPHTERENGVKTSQTAWVPQSKPFWFTELGCAAVDKGPNQPNVFLDPKSAESLVPHFSTGVRDDRAQRGLLEAHHAFWKEPDNNPISSVNGLSMVDPARIFVYTWDARPFPDFPARTEAWSDAENWVTGHWLNGRAGRVLLSTLIETIAAESGLSAVDASACDQLVSGLTIPEPEMARASLEPLFDLYQLDARSRDGVLIVTPRHGKSVLTIDEGDLVDEGNAPPLELERVQDEELPTALSLTYQDELSGYSLKTTEVRDGRAVTGPTQRIATSVVMEQGEAAGHAAAILAEARAMTTRASFGLPEVADGLEPADTVTITSGGETLRLRITEMVESRFRAIKAVTTDPGVFVAAYQGLAADPDPRPVVHGEVAFEALDVPLLPEGHDQAHLWLTAFAEPWPGEVLVYRGTQGGPLVARVAAQSLMGRLTQSLPAGPCSRWDRGSVLAVDLSAGALASLPKNDVLSGANLCAVETAQGWELLQFANAALQPDGTWHLTDLLRGRRGTEDEMAMGADIDARFVLLSEASPQPLAPDRWGITETFEVGPASAQPGAFPYHVETVTLQGTGSRPFAPVHLQARSVAEGTQISWIRRTRVGGDQLTSGDVPLGETLESYDIVVEDDEGAVLETLTVTESHVTFDQPDAAFVTVAQRSSSYGPGRIARLVL